MGCSKYSESKNFPWGLKETVSSEKYILHPRAHNSILSMSVDTLPLKRYRYLQPFKRTAIFTAKIKASVFYEAISVMRRYFKLF